MTPCGLQYVAVICYDIIQYKYLRKSIVLFYLVEGCESVADNAWNELQKFFVYIIFLTHTYLE